jgi:hypothetical protein
VTDAEGMLGPLDVKLEHPSECAATAEVADESTCLLSSLDRVEVL